VIRPSTISVVVTWSREDIDFDAWAARYVRCILDADAHAQSLAESPDELIGPRAGAAQEPSLAVGQARRPMRAQD
jgi:hypothetical protein